MMLSELTAYLSSALPGDAPVSGFLQAVVVAAGTALTGAVTYLFKQVMDLSKKQTAQALEIGQLKGRQRGIQELSAEVLRTVHSALNQEQDDD